MNLVSNVVINFYSIAVLIIIYIQTVKNEEKKAVQYKVYMMMLKITILLLIMDIFSRFDGRPNMIYPYINHIGNFFVYILNLMVPSLWIVYVYEQVLQEDQNQRRLYFSLILLNFVNAIFVVFSQFYGWFYYIDSENIYHRGPLFFIPFIIIVSLNIFAIIIVITNRKKIERKNYFSLIFFAFPPFISVFLQVAFYGVSLMLNCITLSLLIIFVNIQNHSMYTDYLTGINNRKKLDLYLREKINTSIENKTFSAIMIDLNDFKSINDTFGHDVGDHALKVCVKILNSCIGEHDFISRFGGDEFCIILNTCDENRLKEIVEIIKQSFEKDYQSGKYPYKLGVSMGYASYDYNSSMKSKDFLKELDVLMYQNKQLLKS